MPENNFRARAPWFFPALGALLVLGAVLRFAMLDRLELFVDEGGHILAPVDADVRRVIDPVGEGKPAMAWFFRTATALPLDPLIAARAMIGFAGLVTAAALAATLFLLGGEVAAAFGAGIWLLLPFTVFHERLALFDPAIATLIALGLLATALGSRPTSPPAARLGACALGGLLAGSAALLKISALATGPWLAVAYFALQRHWRQPLLTARLVVWLAGFLLPTFVLGAIDPHLGYKILHPASPANPVGGFPFLAWYAGFGGWPLALLALVALVWATRHRATTALWFGAAWIVSLLVARVVYPEPYARYAHADYLPLAIFLASALALAPKRIAWSAALVAGLGWGFVDAAIVRHPLSAPLPAGEIEQYVSGTWSGDGNAAALAFLEQRAPCVVFVHRYSRPGAYAMLLAARRNPALAVVPLSLEQPRAIEAARAVVAKARAVLGPRVAVYVLAEGAPPPEPFFLRAGGVPARVAFEQRKPDGVSGVVLLECEFAPAP
ncbi:MAG TPA: hypothetical protein VHD62_05390 [Opitutaceae bacterium]|nr:hypothetical protein [Opitutaceae bacterium]